LQAQRAAGSCKLFLSLGTSSVVYPAAGLIDLALQNGARILEVNPEETAYSRRVHWSIRGKSGEVVPQLMAAAFNTTP
jgi:NAD-dependent deacetylase